jgi:hypothetical protein
MLSVIMLRVILLCHFIIMVDAAASIIFKHEKKNKLALPRILIIAGHLKTLCKI